jgi:hypothetical protein
VRVLLEELVTVTQPQPKVPPGIESIDEAAALPVLTQT